MNCLMLNWSATNSIKRFLCILIFIGISSICFELFAQSYLECATPNSYAASPRFHCHDQNVTRIVGINIHFLLTNTGTGNYTETTGLTAGGQNGFAMALEIVETANWLLGNNPQMFQPIGNETPTLPVNIQWRLNGVFFDRNDNAFNATLANWRNGLIPLLRNDDNEINVFFSPNPIGASGIASSIGLGNSRNYTLIGNFVDFEGANNIPVADPNTPFTFKPYWFADVMNHELGHLLGLNHPFRRVDNDDCSDFDLDGCDDTFTFCNGPGNTGNDCFDPLFPLQNPFPDFGSCQPEEYSNTFMDYNINHKSVSPCQIERMHEDLCDNGANFHIECALPDFIEFEDNNAIPTGTTQIAGEIWASGNIGAGTTNLHAGLHVKMSPGFNVPRGATFNAGIRNCTGNVGLRQITKIHTEDTYVQTSLPPKTNVTVYPNPTSRVINIQLANIHNSVLTEVFDSFGRLIFSNLNKGDNLITTELPSAGMYIIQVTNPSSKEKLFYEKIVRN